MREESPLILYTFERNALISIGNGGAGPFYGVFPLGMMDAGFGLQPWAERNGIVGKISEPFLLEGEWNDIMGATPHMDRLTRAIPNSIQG